MKTVDTDVMVIAISLYSHLDLEELWIEFGNGIHLRWLPITIMCLLYLTISVKHYQCGLHSQVVILYLRSMEEERKYRGIRSSLTHLYLLVSKGKIW